MLLSTNQRSRRSKSQLREENHFYMKISKTDFTAQIVNKNFVAVPGYNYRIVHQNEEAIEIHESQDLFIDPQYTINPELEFPKEEVIIKRLSNMYGITNARPFIDIQKQTVTHLQNNQGAPHCIRELALYDVGHYKSLFITQNYTQSGKYILVANINGKFEAIAVDDRLPFNKRTLEPVWGLRFENPWEMILIKAWAKLKGGYHKAGHSKPFDFIQTFTDSNWKYFNLAKEAKKFLQHYYESQKFKNGKIILKTKRDENVIKKGFTANSASYQLIAIHEEKVKKSQTDLRHRFVLTVRSTDYAKYFSGQLSFYNSQAAYYLSKDTTLDHDMLILDGELFQFFSAAYITSARHQDFCSGYKLLDIEQYERKAQYFEFTLPKQGFLDFSLLQFPQNCVIEMGENQRLAVLDNRSQVTKISKVSNSSKNKVDLDKNRYLRVKFILVRDNDYQSFENNKSSANKDIGVSKVNAIRGQNKEFSMPRFTTYEIQYFKGYRKGSTHFVKLDPGRYIFRFKSQNVDTDARYSINWMCSHRIDILPSRLRPHEQTELLHDAMVSIMHKYPHFSYDKKQKSEMITIANSFEQIGYGFASIKCSTNCKRSIIIEVDPGRLHHEGYRLKGRYKNHSDNNKKFAVRVESGEYDSIVFKKRKDAQVYEWPSKAFQLYKKEILQPKRSRLTTKNKKDNKQ